MMTWGQQQKLDSRAFVEPDIDVAVEHLKRAETHSTFNESHLTRRLTAALIQRAEEATSVGNLALAWKDLSTASEIAIEKDADLVSKQKNQLVEITIESANAMLLNGKAANAVQMMDRLLKRKIMDWRADRIRTVSRYLQEADELAAQGKFAESINQLQEAKAIQPDLPFIESRLSASRQRQRQLRVLMSALQSAALKCQWGDVSKHCQKILVIAPKHKLAIGAQRHCISRLKRKTSAGIRRTQVPDRCSVSESKSFFQIASSDSVALEETSPSNKAAVADAFLLWVDGVGGYLVCVGEINMIGQAVPQANISIPIMADLRRRHARLKNVDGRHLIDPLGVVSINGQSVQSPAELKHDQIVGFDGGLRLKYTQPHPLSKTARLDFVSRHRTQPRSDAVLLASKSIILGPNRDNHVFCPTWRSDLILFHRNGRWFCRSKERLRIDDQMVEKEGEIGFESRIDGQDFSLTLELID